MWQWLIDLLPQKDTELAQPQRSSLLNRLSDGDSSGVLTVVRIRNGYLVCNTIYNPSGPDKVETTFASGADELSDTLVARLTELRLKL